MGIFFSGFCRCERLHFHIKIPGWRHRPTHVLPQKLWRTQNWWLPSPYSTAWLSRHVTCHANLWTVLGWPGFWDKTPVDLTYCISSSLLLAFWMVLKYIFGVFVLLGEDGFRFIVLVRDVSFGRVMLLYLSCILPRYSPRIHKTSPSLVSRCVLAGGKSVLSSFCRVACTANCILYNCRFLNQNAQQAPLNAAQESLSINPEKSTCTHADGLKEILPVVQQSCGNFRNHDVLCPYSISSFEIYTGVVPSFNRDQSPTFQSIRSFGWSLFSRGSDCKAATSYFFKCC